MTKEHIVVDVLKYDANNTKISLALPEFSRSKIRSFSPQTWSSATPSYLLSELTKIDTSGYFIQCRSLPPNSPYSSKDTRFHTLATYSVIIPFAWATHCFALCLLAPEVKIGCKLNLYIPSKVGKGYV